MGVFPSGERAAGAWRMGRGSLFETGHATRPRLTFFRHPNIFFTVSEHTQMFFNIEMTGFKVGNSSTSSSQVGLIEVKLCLVNI